MLTVTDTNSVPWQSFVFPFRQGLYVDAEGLDEARSVPSAVVGGYVTDRQARNVKITSTGENVNGVYASGGTYELVNPKITLTGNGRSNFVGYGAAVTADDAARVVVDGVVADGGSNAVVKNSRIHTADDVLPEGYQSTVDLAYMKQAPWMLGLVGNVRTTNLLDGQAFVEEGGAPRPDHRAAVDLHGPGAVPHDTPTRPAETGDYTEPTGTPAKVATLDVTQSHDADATFEDIDLKGDFYDAIRGNNPAGPSGPRLDGKNLVLSFDDSDVTGVISASRSQHRVSTITAEYYEEIGVVTNTVSPVVNNGVIVTLASGSTWTITGASYLSMVAVGADAAVKARSGAVTMTVDGTTTPIVAGQTYTGAIKLSVG